METTLPNWISLQFRNILDSDDIAVGKLINRFKDVYLT